MTDEPLAPTAQTGLSKSGHEIREQAQQQASDAIGQLADLAKSSTSDSVKLAAVKELLDRAYGKFPPAASVDNE